MAPIPVYMRSLGARITELTSEFLWSPPSSAAAVDTSVAVVPDRVPERDYYRSPSVAPVVTVHPVATVVSDRVLERDWYHSSSVAPAVTVDTVVYDRVSSTEDVPDRVSSTEDAPVSVGCLEEEFQSVVLQDKNKGNVDVDDFKEDNIEWDSPVREVKPRKNLYPQNPDAADCSNYLWTGSCRNGSNCGYTHPPKNENQKYILECDPVCSDGGSLFCVGTKIGFFAGICPGKKHANMVLKQAEAAGTTNPSDPMGGFFFHSSGGFYLEDELP